MLPNVLPGSLYPNHLSFAIKSICLGVDCRRVKDSLTLLSLAVRPAACSCLLSPVPGWSLSGRMRHTADILEHFWKYLDVLSDRSHKPWCQKMQSHIHADQSASNWVSLAISNYCFYTVPSWLLFLVSRWRCRCILGPLKKKSIAIFPQQTKSSIFLFNPVNTLCPAPQPSSITCYSQSNLHM